MFPVIVLAGGFGTRLRSVLKGLPKPLAPVDGKPFLFWLLKNLERQGIEEVVLSLYYQAELIEHALKEMQFSMRVQTVIEPTPLGTGGAAAYVVHQKEGVQDFLLLNGDTWLGDSIVDMINTSSPAVGLVEVSDTSRYGKVEWREGMVSKFLEKQPEVGQGWINGGIYHLHASEFNNWNGTAFSLERDYLPECVREGRLHVQTLQTDFIDIGVPESYKYFCSKGGM